MQSAEGASGYRLRVRRGSRFLTWAPASFRGARLPAIRLIFVNRFYRPDESATGQLLSDLAEHLAADGTTTLVLTSGQTYRDARSKLPREESMNGVRVRRLPSLRFGRRKLLGRALDDVSFVLAVCWCLLLRARADDLVIAKTDPPFLLPAVALAARLRGARVVNWLQDLFPEVAFAARVRVAAPVRRLLLAVRNAALRKAAANVAIGELMAQRVAALAGPDKVFVVHNWAPFGAVRPVEHAQNPLRSHWGLDGRFVVGYSGNLGLVHEFDTVLCAADLLRDREDVMFLVIGGGAQRESVERAARDLGLANIQFRPYQPIERLAESLSAADAHIVTLRPELEGLVVPSKFYGAIAAGRPVLFIGAREGEIARLISDSRCGLTFAPGDATQLAAAIAHLRDHPAVAHALAAGALKAARTRLGRERSLNDWKALLARFTPA